MSLITKSTGLYQNVTEYIEAIFPGETRLMLTHLSLFFLANLCLKIFEPTIREVEISEILSYDRLLRTEPLLITSMTELSFMHVRHLGMYRNISKTQLLRKLGLTVPAKVQLFCKYFHI